MHENEVSIPRPLEIDPSVLTTWLPSTVWLLMPLPPSKLESEVSKPNTVLSFLAPSFQSKELVPTDEKNQGVIKF